MLHLDDEPKPAQSRDSEGSSGTRCGYRGYVMDVFPLLQWLVWFAAIGLLYLALEGHAVWMRGIVFRGEWLVAGGARR